MCTDKKFQVLLNFEERELGYLEEVPWKILLPFEARAKKNHGGQSLEVLNSRGGLSLVEIYCVLNDKDTSWYFREHGKDIEKVIKFIKSKI